MWSKGDTHPTLVVVKTCAAIMEISVAVPQEDEIHVPKDLTLPLLGICCPTRNIFSTIFVVALFIIAKNQKQPRYPSTDDDG